MAKEKGFNINKYGSTFPRIFNNHKINEFYGVAKTVIVTIIFPIISYKFIKLVKKTKNKKITFYILYKSYIN